MNSNGDVLVADDERMMLVTLADTLESAGYSVRTAKDGEAALRLFDEKRPDLVLLDVMMPRLDGFATCRKIRARDADTPVLFLTALEDEKSQLKGFGCGADDYIDKSLPESLLLARIAAALRRAHPQKPDGSFRIGSWLVRSQAFTMKRDGGGTCALSDREIALLRLFASHPDEVLGREFLMAQCRDGETDVTDGALSVAMSVLREKLGDDGAKIATVRGAGYVYRP